jgi:hypothetical protein
MTKSRREIVAGITAGGIVALAGVGGSIFLRRPGFDRPDIVALLAMLPDRHAAAKLGAIWLGRQDALATSWDTLPKLMTKRLAVSGWRGGDAVALRRHVAAIVRADFDAGAIEDVDGWRVSRFQAELCGLAYLDASRPKG